MAAVVPELVGRSPGRMVVERALLFEALLEVVEEAAGGRATLWFLEDLHWADPSTWDFVVYAARRVGAMALALVVTFRDEELPHGLPWLARFPTLRREPDTVEIGLGRLDQAETRALIQALDPLLPVGAVERITERSAGTPLLVEELVATFGAHPEAVPDVIAMTVRERIRRVDPAVRPVLEAVAVGGPQVDSGLLVRVLPDAPADALDQLIAAGLVVADGDAERPAIAFRHPLLWEAVYRDIPLARRRTLHGRFAQAWDESAPMEPERAARHYELADDPVASQQCLLRGRTAVYSDVGRAASIALAAVDLASRHERLGEHRSDLTRMAIEDLFLAGRWPELEPLVTAQWTDRHRLTPSERVWLANVLVFDVFCLGAIGRARTIAHEEIRRVEAAGRVEGAGLLFAAAGVIAWFGGDAPAAIRLARRALELTDDPSQALVEVWARMVETFAGYHMDRQRARAVAEHRAIAEFAPLRASRRWNPARSTTWRSPASDSRTRKQSNASEPRPAPSTRLSAAWRRPSSTRSKDAPTPPSGCSPAAAPPCATEFLSSPPWLMRLAPISAFTGGTSTAPATCSTHRQPTQRPPPRRSGGRAIAVHGAGWRGKTVSGRTRSPN